MTGNLTALLKDDWHCEAAAGHHSSSMCFGCTVEPCCLDEALIASMTYITARPSAVLAAHCKADLSALGPRACCIAAPNS